MQIDCPYYKFNREERHLAAILFHILNLPESDNVSRLLRLSRCDWPVVPGLSGIYFEFSYLRDLWHAKGNANEVKRGAIIASLREASFSTDVADELMKLNTYEFNFRFIRGVVSDRYIQSPASWQLPVFLNWLHKPEDIVAVCKLKWAFKAKPDIVVQPDLHHALCVELKLESPEGSYPSAGSEKHTLRGLGLFDRGGHLPFPISQTAVQRYMMEKLLGLDTRFVLITRQNRHSTFCVDAADTAYLSWDMLFAALKKDGFRPFMVAALNRAGTIFQERELNEEPDPE